ncbi:hypothetical protein OG339_03045 [Streptosporangium sp. NBC_01495]|uniref:hypothetical protein n=1 Tax=Streptosporangium sp. NBC_01495 TaxID=2903899 RepID=UPI002E2EE59B|nr:hypothetical protein [Streptosporangium sp. NBC_01495]
MSSLKRGIGAFAVAAAVVVGGGAFAAPASAATNAAEWTYVRSYPGTTAGAKQCHASGKLWGTYHCTLYWGKYELWILQ